MRHSALANYVLYQAGWFACVLGGAAHRPLTGAAVAAGLVGVHLFLCRDRAIEVSLIAAALLTGLAIELLQLRAGTYRMTSGTIVEGWPAPWMLMLWAQFATTFRFSLKSILARPAAAAVFGAVGAPLAFLAGDRMGALTLLPPLTYGMERLALSWALAMVLFAVLVRRSARGGAPARYRWF